jgi:hypothetical protein
LPGHVAGRCLAFDDELGPATNVDASLRHFILLLAWPLQRYPI